MAHNTIDTIKEMRDNGFVGWFTEQQYNAWTNGRDVVQFETLRRNNALNKRIETFIVDVLTPEQMAEFVNDCSNEDCYGGIWAFQWNAEKMVFENYEERAYFKLND